MRVGDTVICKQEKINKLSPQFNPERFRITKIVGSTVTATNSRSTITRNVSVKQEDRESDDDDKERERESNKGKRDDNQVGN